MSLPSQPPEAALRMPVASSDVGSNSAGSGISAADTLKRRKAKSKPLLDLRRSASTPQLRKLPQNEPTILSPTSDKKRNKLGYHRTSIACSHCRRRKIRCQIPIPEDSLGRCTNCIRLKKECTFFPVDQAAMNEGGRIAQVQPPMPVQPPQAEGSVPLITSSSSQSSPRFSGGSRPGSVLDEGGSVLRSPQIKSDLRQQQDVGMFGMNPVSTGTLHSQYQYPHHAPSGPWAGSSATPGHAQHQAPYQTSPNSQYWQMGHTPTTGAFAPHAMTDLHTSLPPFASPTFAHPTGEPESANPSRSLSFGSIDGMAQPYNYPYLHYGQHSQPALHPPAQYLPSQSQTGNYPQEPLPRIWNPAARASQGISAAQQPASQSYYPQQQVFGEDEHGPEHGQFYEQANPD